MINQSSSQKTKWKSFSFRIYLETYATSLFIQGCTILQGVLLARLLGPEGRGSFAAIILWPNIYAGLGLLGINWALARRAGKTKDIDSLKKSAVILAFCTGSMTVVCCLFSLPYLLPPEMTKQLSLSFVFLIFIPLNHITLNLLGIDQGAGNFKILNITRSLLYPVYFLGLVAAWFFANNKILWIIISLLVGNGCVAIFQIGMSWKSLFNTSPNISFMKLIQEAFPYHLTTVFTMISQYVDQILFIWLLGTVDLGLYTVAKTASSIITSLPASLEIISFSEATHLEKKDGFIPLATMVRRGFLVSAFSGILLAPFFPLLIPLIYGKEFSGSVALSLILLLGVIIGGLASVIEQSLRGHGKPLVGISARLIGLAVIVSTGIISAKLYGAQGLACSWLLSQCCVCIVLLKISVNFFENATLREFFPGLSDVQYIIHKTSAVLFKISNL